MNYYLETSAGDASVRYELSSSETLVLRARAGEQYRVVSSHGQFPDNVVAIRTDTDLEIRLDNGVHLIIEDYYVVCRNDFCGISLSEEGVPLSVNKDADKPFSGDNTIVYSHGSLEGIALLDLLGAGVVHEPQDPPTQLDPSTVDDTANDISEARGGVSVSSNMMSLAGIGLGLIAIAASVSSEEDSPDEADPPVPPGKEAPVFTSGSGEAVVEVSVNEGEKAVYTAEATDAEGDTLTYSLSGADAALFHLDANTGELAFIDAPDYENLGSNHPYSITIIATDSDGLSASQNVTIGVSNVNERPVFTSETTATVNENQMAAYTAEVADPEGDALTYSLSGIDALLFNIDENTGVVSFRNAPDYENPGDTDGNNVYEIAVTATDSDGLSTSQNVTIGVSNVNERPVFTSETTATVNENQTAVYTAEVADPEGDALTYSLSGIDALLFNIDENTGVVSFRNAPDYENPGDTDGNNVYEIAVTATDSDGLSASQDATISVNDVDEGPVFISGSTATVNENQTAAYTAEVMDPEGETLSYTYSLSGADAALFNLDENTGEVTFKDAPDYENLGSHHPYNISIIATDSDGLSASQNITITVSNVNDGPPVFTSGTTATVNENRTAAYTAVATDPDGDALTYSLSGTDALLFNIDENTGVVSFRNAPDYENPGDTDGNNVYEIAVTATDSDALSASQNVTISVNNVMNERIELSEVQLNTSDLGFVINGADSRDQSGYAISNAGDINGDGLDDVIVGTPFAFPNGGLSGSAYLVFGKADGGVVELSHIENGDNSLGIVIDGIRENNRVGNAVSNAGDVNGDGYADIIFGGDRGYVIYGGNNLSNIEVSAIENVLNGSSNVGFMVRGLESGWTVSGGGDINGDGFDDVYIGTANNDSYVVYGGRDLPNMEVSNIEGTANGLVIHGIAWDRRQGNIVGDVNGDGIDDMIFSEPNANQSSTPNTSAGYVVFGGTNLPDIEFSEIAAGKGGFVINSAQNFKSFQNDSAGDVNGDGFDDLIISNDSAGTPNGIRSGLSYVLFGGSNISHIELDEVEQGIGGFAIYGASEDDISGHQVSSAGDINGDGLGDLILSTGGFHSDKPGISYVVYGKTDTHTVELADIEQGVGGFVINALHADPGHGSTVSHAGDVNGDGFDDLLIGSFGADPNGLDNSGATHVIYGGQIIGANALVGTSAGETLEGSSNDDQIIAGQGDDTLISNGGADVLRGGAGDDILAIRDTAFASLDGGSGVDTLRFDTAFTLDFTALSDSRITDVEKIDLRDDGGNSTLILNLTDVLNLNDVDASTGGRTLSIYGSVGDTVRLSNSSNGQSGQWVVGSETDTWEFMLGGPGGEVLASVLVDNSINVTTPL